MAGANSAITGLAPGRHEVSIDVLPLKNAAGTDFYVDVDSVEVFFELRKQSRKIVSKIFRARSAIREASLRSQVRMPQ